METTPLSLVHIMQLLQPLHLLLFPPVVLRQFFHFLPQINGLAATFQPPQNKIRKIRNPSYCLLKFWSVEFHAYHLIPDSFPFGLLKF